MDPIPLSKGEDKIAIIRIEEVIVAGTEYLIIPKNKGMRDIPALLL
ncbi:hypothetical protein [Oceanobacillus picturae]|nr:hypothetical protein [Oceanobacillus picturae]